MRQFRMGVDQAGERFNQPNVVLAGLQVAHGENKRRGHLESFAYQGVRYLPPHLMETVGGGVMHYRDALRMQIIGARNRVAGKLAARQDARRPADGPAYGQAQLQRPVERKIVRVLQKAHVVHAHHHGYRTRQRRRVLHVQKFRAVPPQLQSEIAPQPDEWIARDTTHRKTSWYPGFGVVHRQIRDEFRFPVETSEAVQKTPNVDFISSEMTTYRMGVNSETHSTLPV